MRNQSFESCWSGFSFFSLHFFIYLGYFKNYVFSLFFFLICFFLASRKKEQKAQEETWRIFDLQSKAMTVVNMWDDQGYRSCCNYGTLVLINCSNNEFSRPYVTIAINWDPHLWLEIWKVLKHFDFKNEPHSNNVT